MPNLYRNQKRLNQRGSARPRCQRKRSGAAAVEFAVAAPVFFVALFACFEFGRVMMIEAFTEEASFRAARHVAVLGATIDEGVALAEEEMSFLGVTELEVEIEPSTEGSIQDEITARTDTIRVTVRVPLGNNLPLIAFFGGFDLEKTAVIRTERAE